MNVHVPKAVAADYASREVEGAPYDRIPFKGGKVDLTEAEVRELLADASYYTERNGPGQSLEPNERAAYRALRDRCRKALA